MLCAFPIIVFTCVVVGSSLATKIVQVVSDDSLAKLAAKSSFLFFLVFPSNFCLSIAARYLAFIARKSCKLFSLVTRVSSFKLCSFASSATVLNSGCGKASSD